MKTFATPYATNSERSLEGTGCSSIGPTRAAQLLEIVVINHDGDLLAIHAMPLRAKFFDFLR